MPKGYFKLYPSRANIWESLKHILQHQEKKNWHKKLHADNNGSHTVRANFPKAAIKRGWESLRPVTLWTIDLVATEPHWPRISSILHIFLRYPLSCFSPKVHLQDLWKRFQFVLDDNLGHFEANLFDRAEIVKEVGKHRRFLGTLERWTNHEKLVTKPDADLTSPRARVSLLTSHEHLREKRRCLAGVQAIKSRFFPIYLSEIPILVIVITKAAPVFFYFCWLKTIILSVIVWNRILYFFANYVTGTVQVT